MSPTPAKLNPFPGLRPFTQEEDYLFFGREEQTLELLQRLGGNHFVAVVGTSGSGKSSLVRCGLLSELLGGRMLDAGASWEIAVTHPGGNPLALLTDALLEADLYNREVENVRENLLATLSRSHFGLVEAVKQADLGEGTNFLIVVDQFEEIFRFNEAGQKQQEAANEFVSLLLEASAQKEVPIYVVLTMRSDFIGECGQFEGLAEMVNRGEFLIPRLTREQYKRVIEGPIKVAGGKIAPRLLQRLLNDLGQQADQLPCLQHALMRTWDVFATKGDTEALDLDDYQRVGKMSQALSLHADEIYESLASDRQRELCKGIFQALTVEESNSRGIRRPQRLGRLCQILEVSAAELQPIIDAYRQSGVTFLMPSPEVALTEQTIIDISHESLMRVWNRLRQWVEEETQAAGIYHRLSESADLHEQGKAGLFRDPELGIALAWRESKHPNAAWAERYRPGFDTAIGFLEASQRTSVAEELAREAAQKRELEQARQLAEAQQLRLEQQSRAALKLRKMIGGLAVVAVFAGLACIVALFANLRANRLAEVAKQNEEQAKKNASRAEQSQQETAKVLAVVESQKATVESSLTKAKLAEQAARTAEETGRKVLYTTDMRLAPFVWRDDRTTAEQLRVLLTKHTPKDERTDLRGFEWRYYRYLLDRSGAMVAGHEGSVVDGVIDPNGQLVTLDEDGQLRRWNLETQEEEQAGRREIPSAVGADARAISPNGRLVAIATGNVVQVYETSTGKQTLQIASTPYGQNRDLIFSRDGDKLVVLDDKIRWCSSVTGEVVGTVDQKYSRVAGLTLSADGLTLAVVGHADTGHMISSFRLDPAMQKVTPLASNTGFGGTLGASAMSPDGQRIAVGAKLSGSLYVIDTTTGRLLALHGAAHASPLTAVAFMGDGTKLATADAEGTIKIWADVRRLTSRSSASLTLKGHQGGINSVGFSSDGLRLVTTSQDQTARVWDMENAGTAVQPLELPAGHDSYVTRFSPDGLLIASAVPTRSASVHLWDASTGKIVRELPSTDKGWAHSVAFSPTDRRLLALGYGGYSDVSHVVLWDIDSGTELARLPGATDLAGYTMGPSNGVVGALAFSPDGKYLVAGFGSKQMLMGGNFPTPLKVWDVASRRLIRRLHGHTNYCVALNFSPDGTLLASGGRDGTAILWSTATWKAQQTLQNPDTDTLYPTMKQPGMVDDVAFSPDGKMLAMASRERNVQLFDVASGRHLETLTGHSSTVRSVVFAPDGRTLVSGGGDQTVRLWNVETRLELMQLDSGSIVLGDVGSLAFSPDGTRLLAGGDNTAIWSTATPLWNDPDLGAKTLELLLKSNGDFQSRIRMLSENLRLHAALEKLEVKDVRVAAALAATQANWHASRQAWPEAVAAFDRLVAADPQAAAGWLRTPGLLRLAAALLHQDRPRDAAMLLTGGAKSRKQDGLPPVVDKVSLGMIFSIVDSNAVVQGLTHGSPAAKSGLLRGDIIEKVDDIDLTNVSYEKFLELLAGEAGTKARLTVRRAGNDKPLLLEVNRERFFNDTATAELLNPLRAAINERLVREPRHPGLLELRAELAGQWSDATAQLADYTSAIAALSEKPSETAAADLSRLYVRRANTHLAQRNWQQAVGDYARVVTDATTDETLLANQAIALAEVILAAPRWTVLKPVEARSELGATLTVLPDDSILASGQNPLDDRYRIAMTLPNDINLTAVRLEALTHDSLPLTGPGRHPTGTYAQTNWKVTATPPDGKEAITFAFDNAWVDQNFQYPISVHGHLNIFGGTQANHTAVWSMANPIFLMAGTKLIFEIQFKSADKNSENLGHFRLALSSDPAAIKHETIHIAATKCTDPWQRLAAAHRFQDDQPPIDRLVERRPRLAGLIGDLFIQEQARDWSRAVDLYNKGITADTTDVDLLSKRARAYENLKNWEAAAADWSRVNTGHLDGAKLLAEFAQRLATAGQIQLAGGRFKQAQDVYEKSLKTDPENDVVAAELAQLLVNQDANASSNHWTILQPTEMTSKGGATLTKLDDDSILVGGVNPTKDTYTFVTQTDLPQLTTIRLEALPDDSLRSGGPGRSPWGNFALSEISLKTEPVAGAGEAAVAKLTNPRGDYEQDNYPVSASLDGNNGTAWSIDPQRGMPHAAVYDLEAARQTGFAGGTKLTFTLDFQFNEQHAIGRFRLSASGVPADLKRDELRLAVLKATDPWLKLAAAYGMGGNHEQAAHYFARALERADGFLKRSPILELVAKFDDVLTLVARRLPDDAQLQLALAREFAKRGAVRLSEKKPSEAQAELQKARDIYTRLRKSVPQSKWIVSKATEMNSKGGEKLSLENDGGIFVTGPNPRRAIYTLKLPTELATLTAIRLETIPDARLPEGGAGRFGNGNFHLAEFTAAILSGKDARKSTPVKFAAVIGDTVPTGAYVLARSIDGNPRTYWDSYPKMKEAHWAVFGLKSPAKLFGGFVSITLDSGISTWNEHGLGHFRISLTDDPEALNRVRNQTDLKDSEVAELNITLAKTHAQQGHVNEAVTALTEALALATDRAVKTKIISEAATLAGVLEKLAQSATQDGQFQTELARHFAEHGDMTSADTAHTQARVLLEKQLAKEPDNTVLAADLADLLLFDTIHWTPLTPVEMKSEGGATLTSLPDKSILASGRNPLGDAYSIVAEAAATRANLIRLEALTHESLPNQGPGRDEKRDPGNFAMTTFEIHQTNAGAGATPVNLSEAASDFANVPISLTYWNVGGGGSKPHTAYYRVEPPVDFARQSKLEFLMKFSNSAEWPLQNLGRFRLSVGEDPAPFLQRRNRLAAIKITDPWSRLGAAYALKGQNDAAVTCFGKALKDADGHEARRAIIEYALPYDDLVIALGTQHPNQPQLQLALARSLAARGRTLLAANKADAALAELKQAQDAYTRLLPPVADWTVLTPVELKSENGSKLELQPDGSIFVDKPAKYDNYTLVCQTDLKGITGLRLEALTDSRLPIKGPGWATTDAGNFVLSELSLQAAPAKGTGQPQTIFLRNPSADFSQAGWSIRQSIDGNAGTGWAINPGMGKDHVALFELSELIGDSQATRLTIRIDHSKGHENFLLGRFRLSVTNDASTLQTTRTRVELKDIELIDLYTVLGQAYVQQGKSNEAATAITHLLGLTRDHATRAKIIAAAATLTGLMEELAKALPDDGQVQAGLARQLVAQGRAPLADAARKKARALFEQQLAANPDNADAALGLADLLLIDTTRWTVLTPVEMQTETGIKLDAQPDASVFVNQPTGNDTYSVKFQTNLKEIRSLRLEVLTDARLPNGGPGWSQDNGNFVLNELTLQAAPANSPDQPKPITFKNAVADFDQLVSGGFPALGAVDGNSTTGWAIYPETNKNHVAIFETAEPVGDGQPLWLTIRLSHQSTFEKHMLGRFRISVSDDPAAFAYQQALHAAIKYSDPWAKLAAAYAASGDTARAADLIAKLMARDGIANWLESGLLNDGILAALQTRHLQRYATLLPNIAGAAVERGQIDYARAVYERLVKEQPENPRWTERIAQLQPGVFAVWNFDAGLGSWGLAGDCELSAKDGVLTVRRTGSDPHFQSPAVGPAGGKAVVLRYRTDKDFSLQLFWADSTGDFSDVRHWDYSVPASAGEWREITLPFLCDGALQNLRLDPNIATEQSLEIDSILLRQLDTSEYQKVAAEVLIEPELARLTSAVKVDSPTAASFGARASFLTRLGRWREAALNLEQERKLSGPDRLKWTKVAVGRILADDTEGYQEHCKEMVEQFRGSTDPEVADSVCKSCLIIPGAIDLSELPLQFLRESTNDPKLNKSVYPWFVANCALISYREGKPEDAIAWSKKHPDLKQQTGAFALVVRALAEHQLGKKEEARKTLAEAAAIIPTALRTLGTDEYKGPLPVAPDIVAHDWLIPEILRREADTLINPKPGQ